MSQQYIEVKPAYGRDYKNASAVKEDWKSGKDFVEVKSELYINKDQVNKGTIVNIRYKGLREIAQVKA